MGQCAKLTSPKRGTKGDVFLGTIDTTKNHKDHVHVAAQIQPFVEKVGRHKCGPNLHRQFPSYGLRCSQLDSSKSRSICSRMCCALPGYPLRRLGEGRMGEKIGKKTHHICVFVKNHHASQAIFRRLSPNLSLRLPVETCFATNFIIKDCLLQVCNALEIMVVDEDWPTLLRDLRRTSATTYM